jgi:antitoxin CptB
MTGSARSSDGLDDRRKRLLYRSWHRGTKEMDLIMGPFADARIADLDESELRQFERLSDVPDHDLYAWIAGGQPAPADFDTALLRKLRAFHLGQR